MGRSAARIAGILAAGMCILLGFSAFGHARSCRKCHAFKKFAVWIHEPFGADKCDVCHGVQARGEDGAQVDVKRVTWILRRHFLGGKGSVFLPRRTRGKTVVVQLDSPPKIVTLSPGGASPLKERGEEAPVITDVFLCGLEKALGWEATLCVETSVPTEVEVRCGTLRETSDGDLYTRHKVVLSHLKGNEVYQVFVVARDLHGRKSAPYTLTLETRSRMPRRDFRERGGGPVTIDLFSFPPDELILALASPEESDWHLGILPEAEETAAGVGKDHPKLDTPLHAAIEACYRCHPPDKLGKSHPVNLPLKRGMEARGVPLVSELVTCASCHDPHMANVRYLLRKKETDLCVSCHGEKYRR